VARRQLMRAILETYQNRRNQSKMALLTGEIRPVHQLRSAEL
jgi:hypothetical protein